MYTETTGGIFIVLLTPLIYAVGGLSGVNAFVLFGVSGIAVIYLFLSSSGEGSDRPGIRFLPGHYLLLLILVLQSSPRVVNFSLWAVLITGTLGYSLFYNRESFDALGNWRKLITGSLYCIMWGVVFFFVQKVLINGLNVHGWKSNLLRIGVAVVGFLYIAIGAYRIMNQNDQRRFSI